MEELKAALQNRDGDSYITAEDQITVGQVRELMHEIKQLRFAAELFKEANSGLGTRLLAGREDKLVSVPGKRPETSAPSMVFFAAGSLGQAA